LAVITDVIDQNWVLADGRAFPGGMMRAPVNLKDISLTHLKLRWAMASVTSFFESLSPKKMLSTSGARQQWLAAWSFCENERSTSYRIVAHTSCGR